MVYAQVKLLDALEIDQLFSVIGGSMGAMQALQWSIDFPNRIQSIIHIAAHNIWDLAETFHRKFLRFLHQDP